VTKRKVLFLCTGNSRRSQMAEGLVRHFLSDEFEPYSAGIVPEDLDPRAVEVMREIGIDISDQRSKDVAELEGTGFDLVVTLCDQAREMCPLFPGNTEVVHLSFPNPAKAQGSPEEILQVYREVRDAIRETLLPLLTRSYRSGVS
jgi:arsenate reductase